MSSGAPGRRRVRRLSAATAAIVVGLVGVAGCGVEDGGPPERVDVGLGLDEAVTTTSTTTTTSPANTTTTAVNAGSSTTTVAEIETTTTIVATEIVPVFFISGAQLTSISIPLTSPATLGQVMVALQSGPLVFGPPGTGLRSAIPLDVPAIAVNDDGNGTAAVNLPPTFFDKIPSFDQRLAVAQIVLSLTNQRGIGSVRFTRFGEPISVILGSGEQSDPGQPVTKADYRSLIIGSDATVPSSTPGAGQPTTTPPAPSTLADAETTTSAP